MRRPPVTRGDCLDGPRPCPWRACRYHLGCEVRGKGNGESCALDLADRGGISMAEVAAALGVSKQRIEQIEAAALAKLNRALRRLGVEDGGRDAA